MVYLDFNISEELNTTIVRKLAPPLVTLLSTEPEIQYVALRNINLILQKRPEILNQETRVFFTKYNDPPYVKLEKLEVLIKLCCESNIDQILSELKEYSYFDIDMRMKWMWILCESRLGQSGDAQLKFQLQVTDV